MYIIPRHIQCCEHIISLLMGGERAVMPVQTLKVTGRARDMWNRNQILTFSHWQGNFLWLEDCHISNVARLGNTGALFHIFVQALSKQKRSTISLWFFLQPGVGLKESKQPDLRCIQGKLDIPRALSFWHVELVNWPWYLPS